MERGDERPLAGRLYPVRSGPVGRVRDGIEAWFDAGITAPIVVPSSISGGQAKAFSEEFDAFA